LKKENIVILIMAMVVAFLGVLLIVNLATKREGEPPAGGIPAGAGSPLDYKQRIAEAKKIVAREPKNLQAWIQLGNDYFDSDQPQEAIAAYAKALELEPNNPNVLTDQGVMFRRVGQFETAIANFEKAQRIDPTHLQSLFNIGVVYASDLKRPDKAIEAWNRFLAIDSTSPQAQQVKGMIAELKASMQKFR